jgi:hypothetical protein
MVHLPRLRAATAAALVLASTLAACGSDGGSSISSAKLAAGWKKATGDRLETRERSPDGALLDLPQSTDRYETYGVFSIYVTKTDDGKQRLLQTPSGKDIPVTKGIRWQRNSRTGTSFSATKVYGDNVVVRWQAGEHKRLTPSFHRLDRAVRAAIAGDPKLIPLAERPCTAVGIDPVGGRMRGTCRDGDVKVTVANADDRLTTAVLAAKLKAVRTVSEIPPRTAYGTADKPESGRFVVVSYELENRGTKPISFLLSNLLVGGQLHRSSFRGSYNLYGSGGDPYPLQPGATATVRDTFDLSPAVAAQAASGGALVLPTGHYEDSKSGSLTEKVAQARLRLAGAPTTEPGGPSLKASPAQTAREASERHVETTVRTLFAAVRGQNAGRLCALLTRQAVLARGGLDRCRSGAVVKGSATRLVPKKGERVRLTTFVASDRRRATVLATGPRFRAFYGLLNQGGRWRVSTYRRLR